MKKEILLKAMVAISAIQKNAKVNISRSKMDFLADKITQAGSQPSFMQFFETLLKLMDADVESFYPDNRTDLIQSATSQFSAPVYEWIRTNPRIAAMIACSKYEDLKEACTLVEIDDVTASEGVTIKQPDYDISVKMSLTSPLAHGSDNKAGNATLFRRMNVLASNGSLLNLPFYSGNAFRGQMRDILGDYLLRSLGISVNKTNPKVSLWFFHALYAGGSLEENSKSAKAIEEYLGKNGAIRSEGIYAFRDTLPSISLLGCALGNRILCGRVKFSDFRPACKQWNNGINDVSELFEWCYLTRREDHEGHEQGENSSMIANTECLKSGVTLIGGIDIDMHISDLEKSALGKGLELMIKKGYIGADGRRGFGKVLLEVGGMPDSKLFDEFLRDNKERIMSYLNDIGALCIQ